MSHCLSQIPCLYTLERVILLKTASMQPQLLTVMEHNITLESPADIARYLVGILGKKRVKEIKFGYRLDNEEPAVKFKIRLRFPYNLFARKSVEEQVDAEVARMHLSGDIPSKLFFQIQ